MSNFRFLAALAAAAFATTSLAATAVAASTNGWARPGSDNVAVYFTLKNTTNKPLTLVGARSPVAATVLIHQSMPMNGSSGGDTASGMSMATINDLTVEPHQQIEFAPGGYHLMLTGMRHSLKLGQRFPVILLYRNKSREMLPVTVSNR